MCRLAGNFNVGYGGSSEQLPSLERPTITFTTNSFSRLYHSTCRTSAFTAYWTSVCRKLVVGHLGCGSSDSMSTATGA